jgi:hypothetical protein
MKTCSCSYGNLQSLLRVSNLYSVLRSASYPVGKKFSFVDAYHFLVAQNYFVAKPQKKKSRHSMERRQMRAVQRTGGAALVSHQKPKP